MISIYYIYYLNQITTIKPLCEVSPMLSYLPIKNLFTVVPESYQEKLALRRRLLYGEESSILIPLMSDIKNIFVRTKGQQIAIKQRSLQIYASRVAYC